MQRAYIRISYPQIASQAELFWLDDMGALQSVPFGAHGLASRFALSLLDNGFHEEMTLDQARDLMETCFRQLDRRYLISSVGFSMKVVDRFGCRDVACKGRDTKAQSGERGDKKELAASACKPGRPLVVGLGSSPVAGRGSTSSF